MPVMPLLADAPLYSWCSVHRAARDAPVTNAPGRAGGFAVAGPSKGPFRDGEKNGAHFEVYPLFASPPVSVATGSGT